MIDFTRIQALIIDMDGVLWQGAKPLPGLHRFFQTLRAAKLDFLLATNNASLTPEQYQQKLSGLGVDLPTKSILTSALVTARYLAERLTPDQVRLFVIGETGLRQALEQQGFNLIDGFDPQSPASHVISGLDRQLTWQKLTDAAFHLQAGAALIGCNADSSLPTEQGHAIGNGAILAALTAATSKKALTLGKPEPYFYQQALERLNVTPKQALAIGDRLETDILGAVRAGLSSILLLSGISNVSDLGAVDYAPNAVMPGLPELTEALQQAYLTQSIPR